MGIYQLIYRIVFKSGCVVILCGYDELIATNVIERYNGSAIPKVLTNLKEKKGTHQSLDLIALVPPITLRQCDVVHEQ